MKCITVVLALLLVSMAGYAAKYNQQRFQLWNNCEPVELDVLLLSGAESIVTQKEVYALVSNKLLYAGIRVVRDVNTRLVIYVEKVGLSLYVQVNYVKDFVQDNVSQVKGHAVTWTTSFGIPYARFANLDSTKIPIEVSVDTFIKEYLRVNADACTHRQD